jgi:peptidoglycan/LPS O-acetylase OafA/YrhL
MSGVGLSDRSTGERFRPDLEGLRAVAVLLVLLYHAGVPGFGGGYVGVDVFFVLSGFLITGIIVRELRATGTLNLPAFYARRARRLLPAAALALVATVIASVLFLPPLRVGDVAADGAAAALYVSNIRFAVQATDYLQADLAPSPLLHYWSLGVEEQFYLFWPALLLVVARVGWGTPGRLAVVVGGVAAGSLALSLILTQVNAPWAFYSLPTRAWELGLGAAIALLAARSWALGGRLAAVAATAGLVMVVVAAWRFHTGTPFPGAAALLPTTGAALVILAGLGSLPSVPGRLLTLAPMRFLGRISYSLYLWHWPVLVIPAAVAGAELPFALRIALAGATIPIAAASQRWVEDPIRRGRLVGLGTRRSLAGAGALTLVVAGLSAALNPFVALRPAPPGTGGPSIVDVLGTPRPSTQPGTTLGPTVTEPPPTSPATAQPVPGNVQPPLAEARDDLPVVYDDGCHAVQLAVESGTCAYGDVTSATTVVLFGDSHAAQWQPTLERLATENGWRLVSLTKALCGAVDHPVWNGQLKRGYPECDAWRASALARIAAEQPALVVVVNSKFVKFDLGGREATVEETLAGWDRALVSGLRAIDAGSGQVVLIGDTPQAGVDPPVCLSAHLDDARACATAQSVAIDVARMAADERAAKVAGVAFLDPTPWVCPSDPCPVVVGNLLVYHDAGHMTRTYSTALAPFLAAALPPVLSAP